MYLGKLVNIPEHIQTLPWQFPVISGKICALKMRDELFLVITNLFETRQRNLFLIRKFLWIINGLVILTVSCFLKKWEVRAIIRHCCVWNPHSVLLWETWQRNVSISLAHSMLTCCFRMLQYKNPLIHSVVQALPTKWFLISHTHTHTHTLTGLHTHMHKDRHTPHRRAGKQNSKYGLGGVATVGAVWMWVCVCVRPNVCNHWLPVDGPAVCYCKYLFIAFEKP